MASAVTSICLLVVGLIVVLFGSGTIWVSVIAFLSMNALRELD